MRTYILGAVAAAALLLPTAAFAQDAQDPCYSDPTSEACLGVGGSGEELDQGGDSGEVGDGGEVVVEVRGETIARASAQADALPNTGTELSTIAGGAGVLLAAGALLVSFAKRRRSATS